MKMITMTSASISSPKNDDVKMLIKFDLFIRRYKLVHIQVKDPMTSVRSPSISNSRIPTDFLENIRYIKGLHHHGPYGSTQCAKNAESGCKTTLTINIPLFFDYF